LEYRDDLVERAFERAFDDLASRWDMGGLDERGLAKCREDLRCHVAFFVHSLVMESPPLFLDYVKWARDLFAGLKIPLGCLEASLRSTWEGVSPLLDERSHRMGLSMLHAVLDVLSGGPSPQDQPPPNPLREEMELYTSLLLEARRDQALGLVNRLVSRGVGVRDLYVYLFQEALHRVGVLWQAGVVSVAQEHYFTASTQLIMSYLYPLVFKAARSPRGITLVGACVSGELHEIGIRMVCDLLEMDGYDTHYLGANTPVQDLIRYAHQRGASAVLLSATLGIHLVPLREMVRAIKEDPRTGDVKVIVGGRPFSMDPELWRKVGADLGARWVDDVEAFLGG